MLGCFFPTQVLFLDDNINHLNSVASEINEFKVVPKLFNNSIKALHYLKNEYKANPIKEQFLLSTEEPEFAHGMIDVDIRAIHRIITNPKRFNEVSVLVSDYSMPDMNGVDFLKNIKQMIFKKIMLTGEAEASLAINAFNNGLIKKFIRKDADDFSHELNSSLDELQENYFKDLTRIVIESISRGSDYSFTCLTNPTYPKLLQKTCQALKIIEYYLLDEHGSYLMADLDGNLTILAVKSQECMDDYYAFAKDEAEPANIEGLKKGDKLPFFYSRQDLATPPIHWEKYLYPAKKIDGEQPFYYALIKDVHKHIPDLGKITSFKEYLENL